LNSQDDDAGLPLTLTAHAREQIALRNIPLEWVARVLSHPELTLSDNADSELLHALARIPEYDQRVLRVV